MTYELQRLCNGSEVTMAIYQVANQEYREVLDHVMKTYHKRLWDVELRVDLLLAFSTSEAPAISLGGYPALAKVRIVGLRDRVKGQGDAEIILDGDRIRDLKDKTLQAILDHELTHLELPLDATNQVKRDDNDRPKLKMRRHDHQYGWFDEIAARHGNAAIESMQLRGLVESAELVQAYLPGFDPWDFGKTGRPERNAKPRRGSA
jgi:hypothetical protein